MIIKTYLKNFIFLLLSVLFTLNPVFGQELLSSNSYKLNPAFEEFSVLLPQQPTYFGEEKIDLETKESGRLYQILSDERYFFISSCKNTASSPYNTIYEYLENNVVKTVLNEKNKFNGEFIKFLDSEDFYQTILTFNTKNRFYIFHTVSKSEDDSLVRDFFDSIKVKSNIDINKFDSDKKFEILINQNKFIKIKDGAVPKIEYNAIPDEETLSKFYEKINGDKKTSLKITSKKSPEYTHLARIYNVSGNVRLRVYFFVNSEVVKVNVAKSLPFGLTKAAIEAAKEIKFDVPYRNGVPYNVTKIVQYNFTIY